MSIRNHWIFYQARRSLLSSSNGLRLGIPSTRLKSYGDRSFSYAGSTEWNRLPLEVRSCCTVSSFKSALKTFCFYGLLHWLISIVHCIAYITCILKLWWFVCVRVCVCVRDTRYMFVRTCMCVFQMRRRTFFSIWIVRHITWIIMKNPMTKNHSSTLIESRINYSLHTKQIGLQMMQLLH